MTGLSLVSTSTNAYIRCEVEPTGNEGPVLASAATSWREDASLVQVTSRGLLVSNSLVDGRVWRLRKIRYNKLIPEYLLK
jgi:hypothetical protein